MSAILELGFDMLQKGGLRVNLGLPSTMPITSKGFARSSLALIMVGLVALIGIVGTTIWLVERTQLYFEEVVEAREARSAAVELRNLLLNAQTSQRGFLLTLDDLHLRPYQEAIPVVDAAYARLADILSSLPQTDRPLEVLHANIATALDELAMTIDLAQTGQVAEAIALVRADAGQRAMADARNFLDAVIAAADNIAFEGVVDQRRAANWLRLVAFLGALVIVAVIGGAAWIVLRYTRELDRAHSEVETLNRDLEARVAERTVDLRRANEEVQRFAYIVTHDLRAPLVNIMGFTAELEESLAPVEALVEAYPGARTDPILIEAERTVREDLPEALGFIRSSTRKMDGLINAILKISREGQRKLRAERLDLQAMVEAAVAAVRHQIDKTDGTVSVTVSTPPVFSDRLALEQILGNLLDNAIKYRHPERPVEIAVSGRQERDGRVFIDVCDNGRGIPAEDHERVFELFRRSGNPEAPGEGIGLPHVRIMARNLGGDIELQSNPGQGSIFTVILAPDLRAIKRSTD
ncbi:MAG TPA: ATP-binding protein [Pelagibacterium sp.]|uniref:sensor histidine kinase n=1 Tax=Pelagibacterium sp. TaxID=1967288 RepID=UPI002C93D7D3|nr:ATP-binding protein [Pelagibacterium sp.]HWJ89305.1 ATP-binding protein [Pelagibacterium sp.]